MSQTDEVIVGPHPARVRPWLERNREVIKDYVQSVGILIAAVWAFYQFYYVEIYKPKHALPEVILSSSVEELGRNERFITLLAMVNVHNKSSVQVRVVSSSFNVLGYGVADAANTEPDAYYEGLKAEKDPKNINRYRFFKEAEPTPISAGTLMYRWRLQPDEQSTEKKIIYVPVGLPHVDIVRCTFRINVARDGEEIRPEWRVESGEYKGKPCVKSADDPKGCSLVAEQTDERQEELTEKYGLGGEISSSYFFLSAAPPGAPSQVKQAERPAAR